MEQEGWKKSGTGRGASKTGDHHRYTLALANGDILSTRVSHGKGQIGDPRLVAHVLRDQLAVTEEDFWACVERGTLPPRPQPPSPPASEEVLDAKLVRNLIRRVGLTERDLAGLSRDEAVQRWNDYLAGGGS